MDWLSKPAIVKDDGLFINGQSIVQYWEEPIQIELAKSVCQVSHPTILEIGYGLGLASKEILNSKPSYYLIVEGHLAIAIAAKNNTESDTNVLVGLWEQNIEMFATSSFDGILFDAYPMEEFQFDGTAQSTYNQVSPFLKKANRIVKSNGVVSFLDFSGEVTFLDDFLKEVPILFATYEIKRVLINPPKDCSYAKNNYGDIIILKK